MTYKLFKVITKKDWDAYHLLRRKVLWEARGRSGYNEKHADDYLPTNHPLLISLNGRPIGTARLDDLGDGTGAMRLVAIAANAQRQGSGRMLMKLVESYARGLAIRTLLVNSAPEAIGYYEKMGWKRYVWKGEELNGIASDCIQMRKILSKIST